VHPCVCRWLLGHACVVAAQVPDHAGALNPYTSEPAQHGIASPRHGRELPCLARSSSPRAGRCR
jgi:hypothetical protein